MADNAYRLDLTDGTWVQVADGAADATVAIQTARSETEVFVTFGTALPAIGFNDYFILGPALTRSVVLDIAPATKVYARSGSANTHIRGYRLQR